MSAAPGLRLPAGCNRGRGVETDTVFSHLSMFPLKRPFQMPPSFPFPGLYLVGDTARQEQVGAGGERRPHLLTAGRGQGMRHLPQRLGPGGRKRLGAASRAARHRAGIGQRRRFGGNRGRTASAGSYGAVAAVYPPPPRYEEEEAEEEEREKRLPAPPPPAPLQSTVRATCLLPPSFCRPARPGGGRPLPRATGGRRGAATARRQRAGLLRAWVPPSEGLGGGGGQGGRCQPPTGRARLWQPAGEGDGSWEPPGPAVGRRPDVEQRLSAEQANQVFLCCRLGSPPANYSRLRKNCASCGCRAREPLSVETWA